MGHDPKNGFWAVRSRLSGQWTLGKKKVSEFIARHTINNNIFSCLSSDLNVSYNHCQLFIFCAAAVYFPYLGSIKLFFLFFFFFTVHDWTWASVFLICFCGIHLGHCFMMRKNMVVESPPVAGLDIGGCSCLSCTSGVYISPRPWGASQAGNLNVRCCRLWCQWGRSWLEQ